MSTVTAFAAIDAEPLAAGLLAAGGAAAADLPSAVAAGAVAAFAGAGAADVFALLAVVAPAAGFAAVEAAEEFD